MGQEDGDVELQKSNILLLGPTGCGKTLLAQTLARILNVPFAIADATALTEAGYVGEDVENILLKLIQAADFDIKKAETGIIYIDEVDKIARKADNPSITRDVSGEGVQQALLKILEGTVASVPPQGGRKHPHQEFLSIDTTNILFICGGAFAGLDKIIAPADRQERGRLRRRRPLEALRGGAELLSAGDARGPAQLRADPGVHRPPARSSRPCTSCSREDLVQILTEPKNALVKQYQRFFGYDTIELVFTEDALWEIADKALERETGARGLRSIIESALLDVMFELPSRKDVSKCVITKETIAKGLKPTLVTSAGGSPTSTTRSPKSDEVAERRLGPTHFGRTVEPGGIEEEDDARDESLPNHETTRKNDASTMAPETQLGKTDCAAKSSTFQASQNTSGPNRVAATSEKSAMASPPATRALIPTTRKKARTG